jgi:hypothetical protein
LLIFMFQCGQMASIISLFTAFKVTTFTVEIMEHIFGCN